MLQILEAFLGYASNDFIIQELETYLGTNVADFPTTALSLPTGYSDSPITVHATSPHRSTWVAQEY